MEELVAQYVAGDSLAMVAAQHGLPITRVRNIMVNAGVIRSPAEALRLAAAQGRLGAKLRGRSRVFSPQHREAMRIAAIARGERMARGLSLKPSGYLEITRGPHKGRSQHCVVAEGMIGRPLRPDEVVHHVDRNRSNNDPSNLRVMTRAEHTRLHRLEDRQCRAA